MNKRTLGIVAALAVAAAVLAILGQNLDTNGIGADSTVGSPFLPGLADALDAIDEVVVVAAGNETLATLKRTPGAWVVMEQDDYPADIAKIRTVLTALAEAKILEEKTSDEAFYSRLGVESIQDAAASGLAVSLRGEGIDFPAVILGEKSGTSYRFARRADEAGSLLIDRNPDVPRKASQWVVPDIVDIRSTRIQRVEIRHTDGENLLISKSTPGETSFSVQAIPEGRELQYATVANVIGNALRELKLDAVAKAMPESPAADVTSEFWTFDGLVLTVNGFPYEDGAWVTLAARFDADQAARFAADKVDEGVGEADVDVQSPDPIAESDAINARLSGWRFRLPEHQYDQITRRMADLLRAAE